MWNSVIVPSKIEYLTPFENNDYSNCKYILENIKSSELYDYKLDIPPLIYFKELIILN